MIINGRYFIDDVETGLYEVSKEEYERYAALMQVLWEQLKIKLDPKLINGRVIVFGTGGDFETNHYADIFYSSDTEKSWPEDTLKRSTPVRYFTPQKPDEL